MADALCGPSNALQSLSKHASADRAVQQDRLVGRGGGAAVVEQGFRSSGARPSARVEGEFDAFQRGGVGGGMPVPGQEFGLAGQARFGYAAQTRAAQTQFSHTPHAPDWAADFQRLNIAPAATARQQPQAPGTGLAWHQDFMRQQAPVVPAPVAQQGAYGGMAGYNMGGFAGSAYMQTPAFQPVSEVAQGKQRAAEAIPAFDEAAFEQAFAQAQQDALDVVEQRELLEAQTVAQVQGERSGELDPFLQRIRETRPAVYSAIQVWSETGLGRTEEAVAYLENMERMEKSGHLVQDANEGRWIVDSLQRIANRNVPQEVKTKAEELIKAINQRLMSQYPLGSHVPREQESIWNELEMKGYMRTPEPQHVEREAEQQKQQEKPQPNDEDEMAATAGRLLERVADNTSEKFQNSQFLGLMRRLRDREVRVQEDKIVAVDAQSSTTARTTTMATLQAQYLQHNGLGVSNIGSGTLGQDGVAVPEVDRRILEHAAMDFEMPIYSDEGHEEPFHVS
ncbi:hypothetical protein ACN47E_001317 [Coniothyrium glycines]